jgi:hypothetical protein
MWFKVNISKYGFSTLSKRQKLLLTQCGNESPKSLNKIQFLLRERDFTRYEKIYPFQAKKNLFFR